MYTVEQDLEILEKLDINVRQLMFMKILIPDTQFSVKDWVKIQRNLASRYQKRKGGGIARKDLQDLEKRGYIVNTDPNNDMVFYSDFEVAPKYMKYFRTKNESFASEIFELYPYEIEQDSKTFTAKNITPEDFSSQYLSLINNSKEEHEKVKEDLKFAIDNNLLLIGLKKFIETKYWLCIREKRKGFIGGTSHVPLG